MPGLLSGSSILRSYVIASVVGGGGDDDRYARWVREIMLICGVDLVTILSQCLCLTTYVAWVGISLRKSIHVWKLLFVSWVDTCFSVRTSVAVPVTAVNSYMCTYEWHKRVQTSLLLATVCDHRLASECQGFIHEFCCIASDVCESVCVAKSLTYEFFFVGCFIFVFHCGIQWLICPLSNRRSLIIRRRLETDRSGSEFFSTAQHSPQSLLCITVTYVYWFWSQKLLVLSVWTILNYLALLAPSAWYANNIVRFSVWMTLI